MPYIKLLTVLAGLALLTACGGAATPKTDNTGGDTNTGEVNTTDCTATPFDTNCDAVESAITSRQTTCFASATANRRCGVVIAGACVANPFRAETACMADTYLPARIAECIKGGEADEGKCATITTDAEKNTMLTSCLKNPFDIVCKMTVADFATYTDTARMNRLDFCDDNANVANDFCTGNNLVIICEVDPFNAICFTDDTYLSPRITDCITGGNAGESKCNTLLSDTAMNTAITSCLTNPFATACESVTAFTDFALARTNRASFCDNSDNITNTLCMGESQMGVCGSNPFNASCFTDKTYLPMRLTDCITTASTELPKCNTLLSDTAMNTTITACLTNPFTDACASNADFMTYADDARTNREGFCGVSGNESKDPCTALTTCQGNAFDPTCGDYFAPARITDCITVANTEATKCNTIFSDSGMNTAITACFANPFSETCAASESAFTTYAKTARDNRVTFCETMGNESKTPCMGATMAICGFNPFSTLCIMNTAYLLNRQTQCVVDSNTHTSCSTVLGSFVDPTDITGITDPTGVLNHADLPATTALAIAANTGIFSHFVSVGADGIIDATGLTFSRDDPTPPTPVTLSRAGDAMDGVTYVLGTSERNQYSFVGILPTTNLGAPLIEAPMDTTWEGSYYLRQNDTANNSGINTITFNIDFAMGKITTTPEKDTRVIETAFDLKFNTAGVITGTVNTTLIGGASPEAAQVRGLIGEQGLVGAFANTDDGFWGFSFFGGFVADNPDYTAPE